MENAEGLCPNCGAPLAGEYCSRCGEQEPDRERLRLSVFLRGALEEVFDLEHSKLWRTLRALVFQPGLLTSEYLRGRRKSFIGPVKLYLAVFGLTILLYTVYQPTSVYDVRTVLAMSSGEELKPVIRRAAEAAHLSEAAAVEQVNLRWQRYLNLTQALYPLGIAAILQLLYRGAHRYFAEHLIFALHFSSAALGLNIVLWPIFALIGLRPSVTYAATVDPLAGLAGGLALSRQPAGLWRAVAGECGEDVCLGDRLSRDRGGDHFAHSRDGGDFSPAPLSREPYHSNTEPAQVRPPPKTTMRM